MTIFAAPFTRSYNSSDWIHPNPVHAFGRNTNQTYDIAPVGSRNPYTWQAIALDDENFVYFDRISPGTSYADAVFRHTETSGRFYKAITYWNGNGWTTRLSDGSMIVFPESYQAKKMADGAPYEIVGPAGNKLVLRRDADRNLQEIRTAHGVITIAHDDSGYITRAQDNEGRWVSYQYNSDGMLVSAIYSSGSERHYEYDDFRMTVVRDEKGHVLLRNQYANGRNILAQQFEDGNVYRYLYQWTSNGQYAERAGVLLPDGTQRIIETGSSVSGYLKRQ